MKHILTCSDIMTGAFDQSVKNNFPYGIDFCYTDPPWGSGNIKYWSTMNKKMTGRENEPTNQLSLEDRVVSFILTHVKDYAFIVYGKREADSIIEKFKKSSRVKDVQLYFKTYKSGSKDLTNVVIAVTLNGSVINFKPYLDGIKGTKGLVNICELFKDKYSTVLEMFIGVGYYLKILDKYGYKVAGNELNAARLNKAIGKISKDK